MRLGARPHGRRRQAFLQLFACSSERDRPVVAGRLSFRPFACDLLLAFACSSGRDRTLAAAGLSFRLFACGSERDGTVAAGRLFFRRVDRA